FRKNPVFLKNLCFRSMANWYNTDSLLILYSAVSFFVTFVPWLCPLRLKFQWGIGTMIPAAEFSEQNRFKSL
ncbi:MAG: hypothetical protein R2941_10445, partial [Desulfobacterales bacterium]